MNEPLHQVDAGDVESDHAGGQCAKVSDIGVDAIGAFNRMIAIGGNQYATACFRNIIGRESLSLQIGLNYAIGFWMQCFERMNVGIATTRITVDLRINQLIDR